MIGALPPTQSVSPPRTQNRQGGFVFEAPLLQLSDLRERSGANTRVSAEPQEERKTMTVPQPRPRLRKPLDAGPFQPEIGSFRLHLAAEGKAA
jgi:hypothetical protein